MHACMVLGTDPFCLLGTGSTCGASRRGLLVQAHHGASCQAVPDRLVLNNWQGFLRVSVAKLAKLKAQVIG
jgi:hypothetical protein